MTRQELAARHEAARTELQAILALGDNVTEEQVTQAEALNTELQSLQTRLEGFSRLQASATVLTDANTFANTPHNPLIQPGNFSDARTGTNLATAPQASQPGQLAAPQGRQGSTIPAQFRRQRLANFKDSDGVTASEKAYSFGMWFLATNTNNEKAQRFCRENGIPLLWQDKQNTIHQFVHVENVNSTGGFLVPPQFESDLIDLREQFGSARRLIKNRTMTSDTLTIPRRTGGLTAYFVTDAVAGTESTKSWDNVTLTAKKTMVLAKASSELQEDAIISVMDDLAGEIAYAFAALEDDCAFNGDGTSTYGGMQGFRSKMLDIDGAGTDSFGVFAMTGNLWSELVLSDFNFIKQKLPKYAQNARTRWVCSQQFYSGVMERLMLAAGGITDAMIAAGAQPRFLGYPVEICQKMPTAEADTTIPVLFGDFTLAASFGDRRQTTIAMSEHYSFNTDTTDIRGTQRFDIVVHDIGTSTVAGPVVAGRTIT